MLITHQRAKHFKCVDCGKRMGSIPALQGHMHHVHKTTLTSYVACHFYPKANPLPANRDMQTEYPVPYLEKIPPTLISMAWTEYLLEMAQKARNSKLPPLRQNLRSHPTHPSYPPWLEVCIHPHLMLVCHILILILILIHLSSILLLS